MAIALVRAVAQHFGGGPTDTLAIDGTGDGNGNYCLFVFTHRRRNADQDVSGITYAGNAMTSGYNLTTGIGSGQGGACFRLLAPTTGSNNIVVSTSPDNVGSAIIAVLLSGVDQTTPIASTGSADDSSGASTVTVNATAAAGTWAIGAAGFRGGTLVTPTIGAGQTSLATTAGFGADDGYIAMAASYEVGAGGTHTLSYTYAPTASFNAGIGYIVVNPAAGGGGGSNVNLLAGKFGALLRGKL
jgi:hypothetical protein